MLMWLSVCESGYLALGGQEGTANTLESEMVCHMMLIATRLLSPELHDSMASQILKLLDNCQMTALL